MCCVCVFSGYLAFYSQSKTCTLGWICCLELGLCGNNMQPSAFASAWTYQTKIQLKWWQLTKMGYMQKYIRRQRSRQKIKRLNKKWLQNKNIWCGCIFCAIILGHLLRNLRVICTLFFLSLSITAYQPDDQASRPMGVGVCDGNHGPRQPLCLQHPRHRWWPDQRPRGANPGRAGYHRNDPQPSSGHFCLYLHICHLSFPSRLLWSIDWLKMPLKEQAVWKSAPQIEALFISTCTTAQSWRPH